MIILHMPVLELSNISKRYGDDVAVSDISFTVQANEIVGLLGPNGAGKTTTINMILGVLEPTEGVIRIDGLDVAKRRSGALGRTNFSAVYAQLPGNLSVSQNLRVFGMIYGVPELEQRIPEALAAFALEDFADTKTGVLSSGEQTRVSLAKAFLNAPKLLLLDEPTASIDPMNTQIIREKIGAFSHKGGGGVLWTSHNMYEVEQVCDRVLFLSHGKILLEGDPKRLPGQNGTANLEELFIKIAREPLAVENQSV